MAGLSRRLVSMAGLLRKLENQRSARWLVAGLLLFLTPNGGWWLVFSSFSLQMVAGLLLFLTPNGGWWLVFSSFSLQMVVGGWSSPLSHSKWWLVARLLLFLTPNGGWWLVFSSFSLQKVVGLRIICNGHSFLIGSIEHIPVIVSVLPAISCCGHTRVQILSP